MHSFRPALVSLIFLLFSAFWMGISPSGQPKNVVTALPARQLAISASFQSISDRLVAWPSLTANQQSMQLLEMIAQAGIRKQQMRQLIQSDPERALAMALTRPQRAALPMELRELTEEPFSETVGWQLLPACAGGAVQGWVTRGAQTWSVTPQGRWENTLTKRQVAATGIRLENLAALEPAIFHENVPGEAPGFFAGGRVYQFSSTSEAAEAEAALQEAESRPGPDSGSGALLAAYSLDANFVANVREAALTAASTWTETTKRVLLIPVDFSNKVGAPVSSAAMNSALNLTVKPQIQSLSYGKTTIVPTIHSLVRVSKSTSSYLPSNNNLLLADAKVAAVATGTVLSNYDIVGVVFGNIGITAGGGSYSGLATIGGPEIWIQNTTDASVLAHELGHNYGLDHSNFWQTSDGTLVGAGVSVEYGDPYDLMGGANVPAGHFHPQGKRLLNWIPAAESPAVTVSGRYRIYRMDNALTTSGIRGLKIAKPGGGNYCLAYRGGEVAPSLRKGVAIYWEKAASIRSWLLDATPGTPATKDGLCQGRTYTDPTATVHISPLGIGGTGAGEYIDVQVNLGAFAGNALPTGSLSGPTAVTARTSVLYAANATDANGDALSYSWDFGDGTVLPNAPVISKSWTSGGTYSLKLTVSDRKGGTLVQNLTVVVTDPLSVWNTRTSGTTAELLDVATDGLTVVAVGGDSATTPVVISSLDGITWTNRTLPAPSLNVYPTAVTWTGGQFVLVGNDYESSSSSWRGVIYTSPTGTNWTRVYFGGAPLQDVVAGNGLIVAVGESGVILTSPNGSAWTSQNSGTTSRLNSVVYKSPNFHIVGHAYDINTNAFSGNTISLRSGNGVNWTNLSTGVTFETWRDFRSLGCLNGNLYASGFFGGLYRSADAAASWSPLRIEDQELAGWAYGNGTYLGVGIKYLATEVDRDYLATAVTEAQPWTEMDPGNLPDRRAAVFFKNTFITVGVGGSVRQTNAFAAPKGFAYWQTAAFPVGAANNAAEQDADKDGVCNLVEYAAGTSPTVANSRPGYSTSRVGNTVTAQLSTPNRPQDVLFSGETSADGVTWVPSGYTVTTNTATLFAVSMPITPGTRRLLRIKVDVGAQ